MKIEQTSEGLNLFLNNKYFKDVNWNDKLSIEEVVRDIFKCIRESFRIKLKGFYKIKVYPNKIGTFIEVKKIDDDNYDGSEINFRIIVLFNKELYLKIDDFFYVDDSYEKLFYNDCFYVRLNEVEDIIKMIDFGDVVLEDEIDFEKCIFLKKKDYC